MPSAGRPMHSRMPSAPLPPSPVAHASACSVPKQYVGSQLSVPAPGGAPAARARTDADAVMTVASALPRLCPTRQSRVFSGSVKCPRDASVSRSGSATSSSPACATTRCALPTASLAASLRPNDNAPSTDGTAISASTSGLPNVFASAALNRNLSAPSATPLMTTKRTVTPPSAPAPPLASPAASPASDASTAAALAHSLARPSTTHHCVTLSSVSPASTRRRPSFSQSAARSSLTL
mmetsp:Transcript_6004/g.18047  ORF Transcript_6004/g.18047 Transcript_6004/m.18047 type:complete len:237 (+) Transcript_6004:714-1424(+)